MTEALFLSAVVGIVVTGFTLVRQRVASSAVRRLAESSSLQLRVTKSFVLVGASAHVGGIRVEARATLLGSVRITAAGIPTDVEVIDRERRVGERIDNRVDIGDPRFPGVFGDPVSVLSSLGQEAREQLVEERQRGELRIQSGSIDCWLDPPRNDGAEISRRMDAVLSIAKAMTAHTPGEQTLLHNALHDATPGVRARNAAQLVSEFPTSATTRSFLDTARERDGKQDAEWRTISSLLDPAARHEFLNASDPGEVATIVRTTTPPILHRLLKGLGAAGKKGEEALVAFVAASPDDVGGNFALGVLAESASTSAVEPLRAARTFISGAAFDRAIKEIKARAENAGDGQLSIAEAPAEAGSLSLAAQAGELSTPVGPRRRE